MTVTIKRSLVVFISMLFLVLSVSCTDRQTDNALDTSSQADNESLYTVASPEASNVEAGADNTTTEAASTDSTSSEQADPSSQYSEQFMKKIVISGGTE